MDDLPDRSLKHFRLEPKALTELVAILSRDSRRAVVKLDDIKIDDPAAVTAAQLHSAKDIDISSYWTNPDHTTSGKRHFVYVLGGPGGVKYFGDSTSDEVTTVLRALDDYFGRAAAPRVTPRPAGVAATSTGLAAADGQTLAMLAGVLLGVAVLFFFIGRWSVGQSDVQQPNMVMDPTTTAS